MAEPANFPEQLRPPERRWRRRVASFGHAGRGVWAASVVVTEETL